MGEITVLPDPNHYRWIMEPAKQAFLDHGRECFTCWPFTLRKAKRIALEMPSPDSFSPNKDTLSLRLSLSVFLELQVRLELICGFSFFIFFPVLLRSN